MISIHTEMLKDNVLLTGIAEADETYIGGKSRKDYDREDGSTKCFINLVSMIVHFTLLSCLELTFLLILFLEFSPFLFKVTPRFFPTVDTRFSTQQLAEAMDSIMSIFTRDV